MQAEEEKRFLIGNDPNRQLDIKQYENKCKVQLEVLNSYINFTLTNILIEQQLILSNMKFPRFNLLFVEQLKNNYDNTNVVNTIEYQKQLICGLIMLRFDPTKDNITATNSIPLNDYYSLEAKARRRKRRIQDLNKNT